MIFKKNYSQLSKNELYAIAKLRQDIFIVEQNSIYVDLDNLDQLAIHFLLKDNENQLFAYARYRVLSAEHKVKIERFVVDKKNRGTGQGKYLIEFIVQDIRSQFPNSNVTLSSQLYACQFYQKLGFKAEGESYDDSGIEHIDMQLKA